jgi:D-glycero-beta-D-manno-heptose 1-phosphate adenylyltransferase
MRTAISPESKIIPASEIPSYRKTWEEKKSSVVYTNGCFDIIHRGHAEYLYKASGLGDILFVGLNSDKSVTRLKGPGRPLQDQESRAIIIASFGFVDYVCIFEEDTPYEMIKAVQPDYLVKGSDYKPTEIVGYDIVQAKNGKIVTIDLVPGYSSSGLIKRMQ